MIERKLVLFALLCGIPAIAGSAPLYGVPINFTGVANVSFSGTSSQAFPNLICPANLGGCGGSFQATITKSPTQQVVNANLWCVDYQEEVTAGANYTANIVSLNTPAATFDNGTQVRYGSIGIGGGQWMNTGDGLATFTDALSRYKLAATLVMAFQSPSSVSGGQDYSKPMDMSRNEAIQTAIWTIMENTDGPSPSTLSGHDISTGASSKTCGGGACSDWIRYAEANYTTVDFRFWGVVSGKYSNGALSDYSRIQTFLVELPEPSFYGIVAAGFIGLLAVAARRRKRGSEI